MMRLDETTIVAEQALIATGYNKTPSSWWANMGHSGQVLAEILLLRELVGSARTVQNVCEIGFNAGHAAVAMLEGFQTTLVEFDLLALPYSNASRAALERAYPGRTRFFPGKSQLEVPRYAELVRAHQQPTCDLWFIDGDVRNASDSSVRHPLSLCALTARVVIVQHTHGTLLDMKAALSAATDGAIIVADDCSPKHKPVQESWRRMVNDHLLYNVSNYTKYMDPPIGMKGWCWGHFRRPASAALAASLEQTEGDRRQATALRVDPVSAFGWRKMHGL